MSETEKRSIFDEFRQNLSESGITAEHDDSLICPRCWREIRYAALTVEHALPRAVGGKLEVLTCKSCNNGHGSSLDAHLSQFQKIADAFLGHGVMPVKLTVNGKTVAANLTWGDGKKHFEIVRKASDPRIQEEIKQDFEAGAVDEAEVTIWFGYSKNRFQTAALRAAYLILFARFGYEYLAAETVQTVRRRICDPSLEFPRIGSLIAELRNGNLPPEEPHLIVPGRAGDVGFLLVILRVRIATITHLCVFMPMPGLGDERFYSAMEEQSRTGNAKRVKFREDSFFT